MAPTASIIAHQGGWDESLLVLVPLLILALLLLVARRRVDRMEPTDEDEAAGPAETDDSHLP